MQEQSAFDRWAQEHVNQIFGTFLMVLTIAGIIFMLVAGGRNDGANFTTGDWLGLAFFVFLFIYGVLWAFVPATLDRIISPAINLIDGKPNNNHA